jgi:FkbM family methyltransferase
MTFISYAQNYEDVMLWRALKDVSNGFWIDIGAAHPREYSVTRAFSERGWCGVNVEPEPGYAAELRAERPRDVNLQVAVGAVPGRAQLQHLPGTGLSTFDAATADRHAKAGFPRTGALEVEVRTLADICVEHAPSDIHFLKIDVEGSEAAVLEGADFARFRPWIVVVEATVPGTPLRVTEGFERHLLNAGYRECWFDGLNTFYLAAEREASLAPAFCVPPNVFDFYIRADHAAAVARVGALEAELGQERAALVEQAEAFGRDRAALNAEVARLEDLLAGMHASTSWRVTAPLRAIMRSLRRS